MLKRVLGLLGMMVLSAAGATGGTISGRVSAAPPTGAPGALAGGSGYDSRRYKFVEKIDYDKLRDFVVYIDQPLTELSPRAPVSTGVTTQKDANFEPHVLPIAVGTTVRWPNEDDIYHNVFSTSDAMPFDLDYYKKERVPELVFKTVGRVDVFCAIHTKMHCIILVLPNPFFVKADDKGRYVLKNVPAGTYRLLAWHERLPSLLKEVVVPAEGDVKVDFQLSMAVLPKY